MRVRVPGRRIAQLSLKQAVQAFGIGGADKDIDVADRARTRALPSEKASSSLEREDENSMCRGERSDLSELRVDQRPAA
jgi:hypothetical protein